MLFGDFWGQHVHVMKLYKVPVKISTGLLMCLSTVRMRCAQLELLWHHCRVLPRLSAYKGSGSHGSVKNGVSTKTVLCDN